jgi:hypothetical protein
MQLFGARVSRQATIRGLVPVRVLCDSGWPLQSLTTGAVQLWQSVRVWVICRRILSADLHSMATVSTVVTDMYGTEPKSA